MILYGENLGPTTKTIHWSSHENQHKVTCRRITKPFRQPIQNNSPSLIPYDKPNKSIPKHRRISSFQLYRYLGFRKVKDSNDYVNIFQPTVLFIDEGKKPLELGAISTINRHTSNKLPLPLPQDCFDIAHIDIAHGDCAAPGNIKSALIVVDRKTR